MRRLPVHIETFNPLSPFGASAVKKTNTGTESQAAIGAALPEFLKPREAAAILRLSVRTLDRYRITGGGPAYFVLGNRIAYARTDLAAWAAARRCRNTTYAATL